MRVHLKLLILAFIIVFYIILTILKTGKENFAIPIEPPKFEIQENSKFNWLHSQMDLVKSDLENEFQYLFLPHPEIFRTMENISNILDFYMGFKFTVSDNLKDIQIGLHHLLDNNLESELDFAYHFIGDNKFEIRENKKIEAQTLNFQVPLDICASDNIKTCSQEKKVYQYQTGDEFIILLSNYQIYYILEKEKGKGLIIHRSLTPMNFPLQPAILNPKQGNVIPSFNWIGQGTAPPALWSVDYLDNTIYQNLPIPPQYSLPLKPEVSISPSPTPEAVIEKEVLPWEKVIKINNITYLPRDSEIILDLHFINLDTNYLQNSYQLQVSIQETETNKKLIVSQDVKKLVLDSTGKLNLNVSLTHHAISFKKSITVQVLLRIGRNTPEENIRSNTYDLKL